MLLLRHLEKAPRRPGDHRRVLAPQVRGAVLDVAMGAAAVQHDGVVSPSLDLFYSADGQANRDRGESVQIRRLIIERFRGIRAFELRPGPRTVLLGPNNTGKSTILEALDLVLHSGAGQPRPAPTELDYFGREVQPGFVVEVVIGALDGAFRADVHAHLEGWQVERGQLIAEPDGEGIEPVVRVRASAGADLELLHEFAKEESVGARFGRNLRQHVGWVFDGHLRDPGRQLAFYQGGLLDQLFEGLDLQPAVRSLRDALGTGASSVNDDAIVSPVLEDLGLDLRRLGILSAEGHPGFEVGAISRRELLQALRLGLPTAEAATIPIDRQGRGAQRLLLLAVLLRLSRRAGRSLIGGFEEPEEALEPLRQRQLVRMLLDLTADGGQVFVVTQSPDVVREFAVTDLVLVEESGPTLRPLATALTPKTRQAYERRLEGPIVRGMFVRVPLLVEGTSDRAVFEVFWAALAELERVPPADHLGLEAIPCEGWPLIPMAAELLDEAGKSVVAWAERDVPRIVTQLAAGQHCSAILYHSETAPTLEHALVAEVPLGAIASAMGAVAGDRGYDWAAQRTELTQQAMGLALPKAARENAAAADSIEAFLAAFTDNDARRLSHNCLAADHVTPFEIKSARPARIFSEGLVSAGAVPPNFERGFLALAGWIRAGRARGAAQHMTA